MRRQLVDLRSAGFYLCCLSFLLAGVPVGLAAADENRASATRGLSQRYPGVVLKNPGDRATVVYGVRMTEGPSPRAAAERWLADHAGALGTSADALRMSDSNLVGEGRFTVLRYTQRVAGLPVENGAVRVVVRNGAVNNVILVSSKLSETPANGFAEMAIDEAQALAVVQQLPAYAKLVTWSTPEPVVFFGEENVALPAPVRAWKFQGTQPDLSIFEAYTFFVNAADGKLVYTRDDVHHVDISGHVQGKASPGTLPDVFYNPVVATPLVDVHVTADGGGSTYSDEDGGFELQNFGTQPVMARAELFGPWARIVNAQGPAQVLQQLVTPPGPLNFMFNATPTEFTTSQVNAFLHTTRVHDFYKAYQPDFTGLDLRITTNVNITDTCNAFYSGLSTNFFRTGGGCVNSAYTTIVAHEYGHFIVNQLSLGQGAFGEGFGDCVGMLLYDTPISGQDFGGPGNHIRDIPADNVHYPCFSEIHYCGEVLGGFWWDLRTRYGTAFGSATGLEMSRRLFTDWSQITSGGNGSDSAHPTTAVEVLTVDDDDGELTNGTPHFDLICAAFAGRSIPCPLDCNSNGTPDFVDIANGTSDDEDDNSVPDECYTILRVPSEYPTIQAAINGAADGDTVLVSPGTYLENLVVPGDKEMLIQSTAGPASTTIDGRGVGRVIRFQYFPQFPPNDGLPDARLDGFTITHGLADKGGGILCANSNPIVSHCIISGNAATLIGGGGLFSDAAYPQIRNCRITDNDSVGLGAGARVDGGGAVFRNCLIDGNRTGSEFTGGGAVFAHIGNHQLVNCTVAGNFGANGIYAYQGTLSINNSILASQLPPSSMAIRAEFASLSVDYTDVQGGQANVIHNGGTISWGTHNIDADPRFADADGADNDPETSLDNDYRPLQGSACIESGANGLVGTNERDIDGHVRVIDSSCDGIAVVDLGAFEFLDNVPPGLDHARMRLGGDVGVTPILFSGYIDPRSESDDGTQLNLGTTSLALALAEPFVRAGGGAIGVDNIVVSQTGIEAPPTVTSVTQDVTDPTRLLITLSEPITPREWTTLRVTMIQDSCGNIIQPQSDLGPGHLESDRMDIGFLPGDLDQNGAVSPLDLLRFRQFTNGLFTPTVGLARDYFDTDRNGVINPLDLLRFRQLVNGLPPATQAWAGVAMHHAQP